MRRLLAIVVAGLVLAPIAAAATKGPVFGLRAVGNPKRGYFIYTLAPGATKHGAVIVSNTGTASGTVKLFPADATTGNTSGTVYLTDQKQYTLAYGLQFYQSQHGGTQWNMLMAASTLVVLPVIVLFFLAQRTFIQGITVTGLKA